MGLFTCFMFHDEKGFTSNQEIRTCLTTKTKLSERISVALILLGTAFCAQGKQQILCGFVVVGLPAVPSLSEARMALHGLPYILC